MQNEQRAALPPIPAQVKRVLVLGAGLTGRATAELARLAGRDVLTHVRTEERAQGLRAAGFAVEVVPVLDARVRDWVSPHTHVVVAVPPDGTTDALVAPNLAGAYSLAYVSSTGVYGPHRGPVDDATPIPSPPSERAARILAAEAVYRAVGACVLRCPGIYGPSRGLHVRVIRGEHRVPGDGQNVLSRIHVEDLAQLLLAASAQRGETFVVGDLAPAPHAEVVQHIARAYGVPMPPSVPAETLHESLRADRAVNPARALSMLGVVLRYPSYREGMPGPGPIDSQSESR